MAQNFNEINSLLTLDKTFDRANGQPLDNTVVWYDLAAAQAYAKTSKAYVGQQIMVIDPNTKSVTTYIITNEEGKLTKYYNQNEVDDELEKKQNILIDGVSIKTINNKSLLGEGNIEIKTTSEADQYFQINDNTLTIRPPSDELLMRVESAEGIALGTNGDINFSANGDIIVNSESIATKPYVIDQLKTKQNQLISGINIKTINGIDILGKGDIDIEVELSPINIHNSTGEFSLQQKQDPDAKYENGIAIQSKNPNAYLLDATLTNNEPIEAKGDFATSFGGASSAQGKRSVAEGTNTIAKGAYSHAEGDNSVTLGSDSHAEGYATVSYGTASHAEGGETQALGGRSHAEGSSTFAVSDNSHAEGFETHAEGMHSHAEGCQTYARGLSAHAEGYNTYATNESSHAEGAYTWSKGYGTHAEGMSTQASGNAAHTEGTGTAASGDSAHAGGEQSQAKGISSFAHGTGAIAEGNYSTAFGNSTIARGDNQFVIGKFNIPKDDNTLFIIGNGGEEHSGYNNSNAFEVYSDGTAKLGGEQVATQQYVNNYSVQIQIDEQTGALYRIYGGEMEWISPPFHDWEGVETTPLNNEIKMSPSYRTIERHNGYPVYVRRIELRDMPLDSEQTITWESVEYDEPNPVIISYSGIMHGLDNGYTTQNIDSISSIVFGEGVDRALLTITINNSHFDAQSNGFGYIDIKYIKQ